VAGPRTGYDRLVPPTLDRPTEDQGGSPGRRQGLTARLAVGVAAAVVVSVPFTLLTLLVLSEWEPLHRLDHNVAEDLNDVAQGRPDVVDVLDVGAVVSHPWVFRAAVLCVAVWLWRRGSRRLALWAAVTMALGSVLGAVLKVLVDRARPSFPEPVATAAGLSFPSGHALNSMLGVAILLVVLLPRLDRAGRRLACSLGAVVVLLTGYDRVALGVHYVSDVVAGWVVALTCLVATSVAFGVRWGDPPPDPPAAPVTAGARMSR
jgi:undecaprenyl-diphosphatase